MLTQDRQRNTASLNIDAHAEEKNALSEHEHNDQVTLQLLERLDRIEAVLQSFVQQQTIKDYYTTAEVAQILGKAEFTVREWCRLCRVYAEKRPSGRGRAKEWIVSHQELTRIRNEGLLPLD